MNEVLQLPVAGPAHNGASGIGLPRLGFLGLGWIGRHRLKAIAQSAAAEMAVLADPVHDAVIAGRAIAPRAMEARDLDELLDFDLDGIVIATPSALHAEQAMAALDYGCAVFCQKPLGRTAAECRALVAKARAVNRLLGVDLCYRHTAGMKSIRQVIRAGELGDVYAAEMVFHNAYGPDKPWFYDARLSGGGCLIDLGTHLIDLALWCLDFPQVKRATASFHRGTAGQVEDYGGAQLELETGTSVQLACSWKAPAGCEAQIGATFLGTKGGACFRNVNGSFYDFIAERLHRNRTREVLASPPDDWGGRGIVTWANQLATARAFDAEIETAIRTAATIDALYQSCL
ncbi:MAG TPA: Gfo/Idh/MocA family oxidoreductase [Verrucomicrobiae bacterium]|nr:Gfo/Idh/MocA family oxidoreductase [Verrucomicrobiae bacterium]